MMSDMDCEDETAIINNAHKKVEAILTGCGGNAERAKAEIERLSLHPEIAKEMYSFVDQQIEMGNAR